MGKFADGRRCSIDDRRYQHILADHCEVPVMIITDLILLVVGRLIYNTAIYSIPSPLSLRVFCVISSLFC